MTKEEKVILFIVLPFLLFFAYSPSLNAPFLFDDIIHIEKNDNIHIKELSCDSLEKAAKSHRPIPMITFALTYYIHGLNPFSFRIFNIVIHFLNSILVFFVAKNIIIKIGYKEINDLLATSIAVIWSVHPIQIQSVTYIVQRMNILSFFFCLIAILLYFKSKDTVSLIKKYIFWTLILISIVFAVFSKQNAIIIPIIFIIFELIFYKKTNRLILLIIFIISILLISYFLYTEYIPIWYSKKNYTPLQRVLTELRVVIFYILLIIFPHKDLFNIDHDFIMSYDIFRPVGTFYSFLLILIILLLSIYNIKKYPLFFFGLISFFISHSVESSIVPLDISFEHRNYAPSFYLILFLIFTIFIFIKNKNIFTIAMFIVCIFLIKNSFERNKVWKDGVSLWTDSVMKSPMKLRPTESLAYYLEKAGRIEESIFYYKKAVEISPENVKNYNILGRLYVENNESKKALDLYKKGLEMNPNSKEIYNSIGELMFISKKYEESIFYFKKSINIDKKYTNPYINMANSLAMIGYTKSALENYNIALLHDKDNIDAMYNKSILLVRMNMLDDAEKLLQTMLILYPDFKDADYLLKIIQNNKENN